MAGTDCPQLSERILFPVLDGEDTEDRVDRVDTGEGGEGGLEVRCVVLLRQCYCRPRENNAGV